MGNRIIVKSKLLSSHLINTNIHMVPLPRKLSVSREDTQVNS